MKFSTSVTGSANIDKALLKVSEAYRKKAIQNLGEAALVVQNEAIKLMQKRSSGEEVTRYKPKRRVKVSKPGDAPNVDTGVAIRSVGFNVDKESLAAEVGTDLLYLKHLEFGTTFFDARPWLFPALKRSTKRLKEIFKQKPKIKKKGT